MRQLSPDPLVARRRGARRRHVAAGGDAGAAGRGVRGGAGVRRLAVGRSGGRAAPASLAGSADRRPPTVRRPHRAHPRARGRRARSHRLRRRVRRRRLRPAPRRRRGRGRARARDRDGRAQRRPSAAPAACAATSAASWWRRDPRRRGPGARSTTAASSSSPPASASWPPEEKLLFDARGAQWASPYGLLGHAHRRPGAGRGASASGRSSPCRTSDDVKRYWARAGFFHHAAELFELHGKVPQAAATGPSDVLLDVTPVRATEDVHEVVEKISEGAIAHSARRAGTRDEGDAPLQYGAFGGMPEYCGARRHQRLGGGAGVYLPAPARPAGGGDRGERRGDRLPPLAREHPRQAVRRALGRRRGARGGADPGREPVPRSRAGGRVSPSSSASWISGRARSRSGAAPRASRSCRPGTRTSR